MSIYDKIDGVLKILDIPFYDTMPTFAENDEPPLYVVYNLYDTPAFRGDGKLLAVEYTVTINVLGTDISKVDKLQSDILEIFQEYDFVYAGCNYEMDTECPTLYRRVLDFKFDEMR